MNIRRIASEVYQAMWSRPQCTLPRARNMRQEDIDRIAKAIDDAVQEALNQTVLVSEWQEQQSELTQLREQNRVLRGALEQIAMSNEVWERDQMIDCAQSALTATMPAGGEQDEKWMVNRQRRQYAFTPEGTLLREEPK